MNCRLASLKRDEECEQLYQSEIRHSVMDIVLHFDFKDFLIIFVTYKSLFLSIFSNLPRGSIWYSNNKTNNQNIASHFVLADHFFHPTLQLKYLSVHKSHLPSSKEQVALLKPVFDTKVHYDL